MDQERYCEDEHTVIGQFYKTIYKYRHHEDCTGLPTPTIFSQFSEEHITNIDACIYDAFYYNPKENPNDKLIQLYENVYLDQYSFFENGASVDRNEEQIKSTIQNYYNAQNLSNPHSQFCRITSKDRFNYSYVCSLSKVFKMNRFEVTCYNISHISNSLVTVFYISATKKSILSETSLKRSDSKKMSSLEQENQRLLKELQISKDQQSNKNSSNNNAASPAQLGPETEVKYFELGIKHIEKTLSKNKIELQDQTDRILKEINNKYNSREAINQRLFSAITSTTDNSQKMIDKILDHVKIDHNTLICKSTRLASMIEEVKDSIDETGPTLKSFGQYVSKEIEGKLENFCMPNIF